MSCTFWNMRRRKKAEFLQNKKLISIKQAEQESPAEQAEPKPKKGGGKNGK